MESFVSEKKDDGKREPRWIKVTTPLIRQTSRIPLSQEFLGGYPLLTKSTSAGADEAKDWLRSSYDLPLEILDEFGVRYQSTCGQGSMNLGFPLTNRNGAIVDMYIMPVGGPDRLRRVSHEDSGYDLVPALWFGQYLLLNERSVILVRNLLDALNLARFGVKGVLASCCWPTKVQFMSIKPEFSYFAFDRTEDGKQAIRDGMKHMQTGHRHIFLWSEIGVHSARKIESLAQFKVVYSRKLRILSQ